MIYQKIKYYTKCLINSLDNTFGLNMYGFVSEHIIKYLIIFRMISKGYTVKFNHRTIEISKNNKKVIISYKHLLYTEDVGINFNYYHKAIKPKKIDGYYILDFSKPKLHHYINNNFKFYYTSLPEEEWEISEYTNKYKPTKGDVIFDIGAYCGLSTYYFSKMVGPMGRVFSFEPDTNNQIYLNKNIKLHTLSNVVTVKKGVWSEKTKLEFFDEGALGSSIKSMGYRNPNSKSVKIDVMSLEDYYTHYNLSKINLIKMDIEGAEIEAIEGSIDFIRNMNIHFAISSHFSQTHNNMSHTILKDIFKKIGYKTHTRKITQGNQDYYLLYTNNN